MLREKVLRLLHPDEPETRERLGAMATLYQDVSGRYLSHLPWVPVSPNMAGVRELADNGIGEFVDVVYMSVDEFDRLADLGFPVPDGTDETEDALFDALDASGRHWAAFRDDDGRIFEIVIEAREGDAWNIS